MIAGIGTNIIRIERIRSILEKRSGEAFARRILTNFEWSVFAQHNDQGTYLAKRFAAKERLQKQKWLGSVQLLNSG